MKPIQKCEAILLPVLTIHYGDDPVDEIGMFTKSNSFVVRGSNNTIIFYDLDARAAIIDRFQAPQNAFPALAVHDSLAAVSGEDNSVVLLNIDSLRQMGKLLIGNNSKVNALAFSTNGEIIAGASLDGKLTVRDSRTQEPKIGPLQISGNQLSSVVFIADNRKILLGGMSGQLYSVDWSGKKIDSVRAHNYGITHIVVNPVNSEIFTAGLDDTIKQWTPDLSLLRAVKANQQYAKVLSVSADSRTLASGGQDGSIHLFQTADLQFKSAMPGQHLVQVTGLVYVNSGSMLVSASVDRKVIFWDTERNEAVTSPFQPHNNFISGLAASSKNRMISVGGNDVPLRWITDPLQWMKIARNLSGQEQNPDSTRPAILR